MEERKGFAAEGSSEVDCGPGEYAACGESQSVHRATGSEFPVPELTVVAANMVDDPALP